MVTKEPEAQNVTDALFEHIGFTPTEQQKPILTSDKRNILICGGERAGKSMISAKFWLKRWNPDSADHWDGQHPLLYWLVAADYERTRPEFNYIVEDLTAILGPGIVQSTKRVDPGYIEIKMPDEMRPRVRIETKSAKDPRTIAAQAPNGIIICEASQVDYETYMKCAFRLGEKRGWLLLSGTLEGSLGWYPGLIDQWALGIGDSQSFSLPSYSNIHIYPGGRDDPEILKLKAMSSDEFFMERIEGKPVPPRGLVFSEFRANIHVRDIEWIADEPVHVWIDPGYAGAYAAEIIQIKNDTVYVVDEIYEQGLVTEQIIEIAQSRPWWKDVRYGVADVAALQHQAMPAVAEVWSQKAGLYMATKKVGINEGIERLKTFLKPDPLTHEPKVLISPGCKGILSEFGVSPNPFDGQLHAYMWKTDREGAVVGTTPDDRYNHGIKALTYGLIDRYGFAGVGHRKVAKVVRR